MRPDFSLDDFKKWIKTEETPAIEEGCVGVEVQATVGLKKLMTRCRPHDGDKVEVCKEFFEDGGTILEEDQKRFLIAVESGSFFVPKECVETA